MEWWHAVILGLVEGITEYLPVSSTGHLILATELMRFDAALRPHVDAFNIVIQGGAILAVLGLYRRRVGQMIAGTVRAAAAILLRSPSSGPSAEGGISIRARLQTAWRAEPGFRLAMLIVTAFLPAAVLGVLLDELIESTLFHAVPVLIALALGGVWMIWLDRWRKHRLRAEAEQGVHEANSRFHLEIEDIDVKRALGIGLLQCVAMWPGTSRSMMTIAGGTVLGLRPAAAAEFSFLLGLPTLGGACVYKLAKNIHEARTNQAKLEAGETLPEGAITQNLFEALGWAPTIIGLVVATASAALAVRWLVGFLNRRGLAPFGWYRLALCVVLGGAIALGWVVIG
ncbi:MAG: undecaprenyl-diphosphate phosphatase [Planctomycetota bacterium]